MRLRTIGLAAATIISIIGIVVALINLIGATKTLSVEKTHTNSIPTTLFLPQDTTNAPVVLISHGFAASQQIMFPFATTLARNGYIAITFDLPGHGQNATPIYSDLMNDEGRYQELKQALNQIVAYAQSRWSGHEIALLGHSMGSAAVTRYAQEEAGISAVVAVSLVYDKVKPDSPRNLLVVNGEWEGGLNPLALEVITQVAGDEAMVGVTYGNITEGTARRVVFAPSSEHIGVLFNETTLKETLTWLNQSFGLAEPTKPYIDQRGNWLILLYASAILLYFPTVEIATRLIGNRHSMAETHHKEDKEDKEAHDPNSTTSSSSFTVSRKWRLVATMLPAFIAPVLLRFTPIEPFNAIIPVMVGSPLALFFAFYGLVTGVCLLIAYHQQGGDIATLHTKLPPIRQLLLLTLFLAGYIFLAFGLPAQAFVLNYFPALHRLPLVLAIFVAMLPYFVADELLTHRPGASKTAYFTTKVAFFASLGVAIVLNPFQLFFLVIVAPVLIAYFALCGSFGGMIYRRTGTPLPAAIANAAIFASSVGAVFPLMG